MESPLYPPGTRLIETILWDGSRFPRLPRHRARLAKSAAHFGFLHDPEAVLQALSPIAPDHPARVRLTLGAAGDIEVTTGPVSRLVLPWRVGLARGPLDSGDNLLRHKTSQRARYDHDRAHLPQGIDELIYQTERGEVCEGTITSVFFDLGGGLCTPPLDSGCLPGVLRAEMLETGTAREEVLPATRLRDARIWVGNALRGLIPARYVRL
jgi:4-amino-4-deoxychorismate lyase